MSKPAYEIVQKSHFNLLREAHLLARKGKYTQAMTRYRRALTRDITSVFCLPSQDPPWRLALDEAIPSINWICIYFGEYLMFHSDFMSEWLQLIEFTKSHPDFMQLPAHHVAQITQHHTPNIPGIKNEQVVSILTESLNTEGLSAADKGIHHMFIGLAWMRIRNEGFAFEHIQRALDYLDLETEPFYAIIAQEQIGTISYFLNQGREDYHHKAIENDLYVEQLACEVNDGIDFTHQAYNLGWIYAELEEAETARYHFERGYQNALDTDDMMRQGKYAYGIGYTYFLQDKYYDAVDAFDYALSVLPGRSTIHTAATLNLMSSAYLHLDLDLALQHNQTALANLRTIDSPVQMNHAYERFCQIYRKKKRPAETIYWWLHLLHHKWKHRLPPFKIK